MKRRRAALIAVFGGAAAAIAASLTVLAQPTSNSAGGANGPSSGDSAGPPGVPILQAPPDAEQDITPPTNSAHKEKHAATNSVAANAIASNALAANTPPPPPIPVRSPAAILQTLDKVTTETMQFAAPVGQRVRYKNLVFTVKACETTGLGTASPQASAYVEIVSAPVATGGMTTTAPKEVFHGWMFANSPELHAFQHPIYDAWLIACMAQAPKT